MLAHGDTESVNLRTGERRRRVVGNGESWLESLGIPGLKPVNPADLAEYEQAMTEAIPEIERVVRRRLQLAAEARQRILWGETNMHYRNGREAKNGDKIVMIGDYGSGAEVTAVGVLYGATPGNDHCNGQIAPIQRTGTSACLCDCLHVDDLAELLRQAGLDKRPAGM